MPHLDNNSQEDEEMTVSKRVFARETVKWGRRRRTSVKGGLLKKKDNSSRETALKRENLQLLMILIFFLGISCTGNRSLENEEGILCETQLLQHSFTVTLLLSPLQNLYKISLSCRLHDDDDDDLSSLLTLILNFHGRVQHTWKQYWTWGRSSREDTWITKVEGQQQTED